MQFPNANICYKDGFVKTTTKATKSIIQIKITKCVKTLLLIALMMETGVISANHVMKTM